jgi:hypothetical protein
MPDALSALIRLFSVQWNGLPVASLVVFAVGGLMYVAMSRSSTTATTPRALAVHRPGWIARRRARAGIRHRHDRVAQRNLFNRFLGCLYYCLQTHQTYAEQRAFPTAEALAA